MNEPRLIYSIPEVAALLGISRSKAYRYARTGELQTVRFHDRIGVPETALGQMLEGDGGEGHRVNSSDHPINKVLISGRLTRDPDMRTTRSGLAVCIARLAAPKRTGDERAVFIDVVAYGDVLVCWRS